jgi:phospholipid/cholesterol/gamma-HCH transport system permease protein
VSVPSAVTAPLRNSGLFVEFAIAAARALPRRPFAWRDLVQQAWLIARVTAWPAAAIGLPIGAALTMQLGGLTRQLGAQPLTDAAAALGIVREAAPLVTALVLAGPAAAAICADLAARTARHEVDALAVLGIDPVRRLVVPRVLACAGIGLLLNGLVCAAALTGGYLAAVVLGGDTAGDFWTAAGVLAQLPDLLVGALKGAVFGLLAALAGAHRGLAAHRGAAESAGAVAGSAGIALALALGADAVLSAAYLQAA